MVEDGDERVYQSITVVDAEGTVLSRRIEGALDADAFQKTARPWSHLDDAHIYDEKAWSMEREDGTIETGYRGTRKPASPAEPSPAVQRSSR